MSDRHRVEEHRTKDIKKAAKGYITAYLGSVVGRGLNFFKQVILARFLGVEIFGLYTIGFVVVKIVELLARFGLNGGALKFVPIYRDTDSSKLKGTVFSALIIPFFNGIIMGTILYLLSDVLSSPLIFNKPELKNIIRVFAFGVPFLAVNTVLIDIIQGFHMTQYSTYMREFIQPAFNVLLIAISIYSGLDLSWIICAFIVSNIVSLIWGIYILKNISPCLTDRTIVPSYEMKSLLSFSGMCVFTGILYMGLSWTDTIMLGYLGTSKDVGVYRAASQVPLLLTTFLFAANTISAPLISELFHHNQIDRLKKMFKSTTRWIFYLTLPTSIVLLFSAKEIMSIFGSEYIEGGSYVLMILTIGQFVNCCTGIVAFTLTMTGNQRIELLNSLVMVISNIFFNYILIPKFGVIGAAIATGLTVTSINIVRLVEVYVILKIQPYDLHYMRGIASGIVTAIALFLLSYMGVPSLPNLSTLLLNGIVGACVFFTMMFFMGIADEDRFVLNMIKDKLNTKALGRHRDKIQ